MDPFFEVCPSYAGRQMSERLLHDAPTKQRFRATAGPIIVHNQ